MAYNDATSQLRIGVVGLGPVGATLAAHLIDAGAFVVPCDIDRKKIDLMKKAGISLENKIHKEVPVTDACYSAQELKQYDLDVVAISVKTPNLKMVLSELSKITTDKTIILCVQNGLDNEIEVANIFGKERTLRMAVNYAGGMPEPNTVHVIFFNPPNYIAALDPQSDAIARRIADLLNSVGLKTEIPDNIRHHTWEKAILNSALSPVCAITRLTMKEVMDFPSGFEMVKAILVESIQVAKADGITFGLDFLQHCIKYLQGGGYHRPSMYVDLENGLLTEIDYLNGRIAEYGRRRNIPTPINRTITAIIHMLEQPSQ